MKFRIGAATVGLFVLFGTASLATAQNETKTTHKKVRTVTGCLQKTDDASEYKLTTAAGGTWEMKSDDVNLGEHVGHTVTVTGAVSHPDLHGAKEDAKDEAKEHGMDKHAAEHGHLTVTAVKMVSHSCKE
jgi:hypothetical protein